MKLRVFIFLLFAAISFGATSQTVNGIKLKELDVNYLRIYGRTNFIGTKMVVRFEFGQRIRFFDSKNRNVTDENGNRITFNTMIDALNFISAYGYRLIQTYNTISGSTVYYHYIMEKIGLIENKGVNQYSNSQNSSYRKMEDYNQNTPQVVTPKEPEIKKEKTQAEKEKEFEQYLKEKENKETSKEENNFEKKLDKLDNFISNIGKKKEENSSSTLSKEKEELSISCSSCNGDGIIKSNCPDESCNSGKISKTCTYCNANYKASNDVCYKCEGSGCEYCDYDGLACSACKEGVKTGKHDRCEGTGKISKTCSTCNGEGKIQK